MLRKLYEDDRLYAHQIGAMYGAAERTVTGWLERDGIPRRTVGIQRTPLELRWSRSVGPESGPHGCWPWVGYTNSDGYGRLGTGGRNGRLIMAHRVAYEMRHGPVPCGMELDHFVCDNRACVNPTHMRPVKHRENVLRGNGFGAWNLAKTHCIRGHEFTSENTRLRRRAKTIERVCRACKRVRG